MEGAACGGRRGGENSDICVRESVDRRRRSSLPIADAPTPAFAAVIADSVREVNGPTHDLPLAETSSLAMAASQGEVEVEVEPDVCKDEREGERLIHAEESPLRRCDRCCCLRDMMGDRDGAGRGAWKGGQ